MAPNSLLKKPPGEGTGPTMHADFRGNLVGRVPSRGEGHVVQQTARERSRLGYTGRRPPTGTVRLAIFAEGNSENRDISHPLCPSRPSRERLLFERNGCGVVCSFASLADTPSQVDRRSDLLPPTKCRSGQVRLLTSAATSRKARALLYIRCAAGSLMHCHSLHRLAPC